MVQKHPEGFRRYPDECIGVQRDIKQGEFPEVSENWSPKGGKGWTYYF